VHWNVLVENLGALASGLLVTLEVSALAFVLAAALGLAVATLRVTPSVPARAVGTAYVELIRNVPLIVQIFFLFFALPSLGIRLPAFACGVLGLGIYTAAFVAEAIRSGIAAVPAGQLEAARASGLSYVAAMRLVILPQAIRLTIPPLGNTTLNMIKNSSLVSTIAIADVLGVANLIGARTFSYVPMFVGAALAYLIVTLPAGALTAWLEQRYAIPSNR
jgi:putative glutamine transport system permease protein